MSDSPQRPPTRAELDAAVALAHVARHDLGPLSLYNYTKRCIYERGWTPVTVAARGLLFREETLVALPFPKFFNHNEPDAVIPDGPPTGATVKVDGVLGISYHHEGRLRWTTRGRLDSPPGRVAQRLWDAQHADVHVPPNWTLLAEIVSPETRIIINYDGLECLMILGARTLDGGYVSRARLEDWCAKWALRLVESVSAPSLDALRTASADLPPELEGWVLEWGHHRIKVKGVAYLEIARLIQGMTPRFAADLWVEGVQMSSLMRLPEETRGWLETQWSELSGQAAELRAESQAICESSPHWKTDRKAFVAEIGTKHPRFGTLMHWWARGEPNWKLVAYQTLFQKSPRSTGLFRA